MESMRPKSWETLVYRTPPVKLHHRLRMTVKVKANQHEEASLGDGVIEDVLADPIEYLPQLTMYNFRLSFKTKNRKYKFYIGRENMTKATTGNGTYYFGLKLKM